MSRNVDARILNEVFGFRWKVDTMADGTRIRFLTHPASSLAEKLPDWDGMEDILWREEWDASCPRFTSSPDADYSVLVHVRKTWSDQQKSWFIIALCGMLHVIARPDHSSHKTVWLVLFGNNGESNGLTVGDFSRAALAVVAPSLSVAGEPAAGRGEG